MSRERVNAEAARYFFRSRFNRWLERAKQRLYPYRPRIWSRQFWAVQGLVVGIAVIHDVIEGTGFMPQLGVLYIIPISLFFVPVVYAALNFGFAGAITTALWAIIITLPNWVFWHQGLERWGVIFQMAIVLAMAVFVGQRVDREKNALQQAEATSTELKTSRMKYLSLFESSPIAVLVFDLSGIVLEANPAASSLFGRGKATLEGTPIADLLGTAYTQKLLGSSRKKRRQADSLVLKTGGNQELHLEPMLTEVSDGQGNFVTQILFRDVTEEYGRQADLKAYAAHVVRVQEEERQRISRELHDGTIQSLSLLYRRLDALQRDRHLLSPSLSEGLIKARETAEEVVSELRDFTKTLRPPILDDFGIVTSVRKLLADFTERTKVKNQLKVVGETRRLPADTELSLFRITQEALWNIERHAKATGITVTLSLTKHEARLKVVDDGVGFSMASFPHDFVSSGKLGLLSIQERAELLNGKLEIQSSPGNGTSIIVSIPVTDAGDIPGTLTTP